MENDKKLNSSVLVVGATGNLGMEICRQLVDANKKVKALVRNTSAPEKVEGLKKMGVETVVGDIKDPFSLRTALQGVEAVISTASSTMSRQQGDSIESVDLDGQQNVIESAASAGVKKFIFVSFTGIPGEFPLQSAKRKAERKLKDTGMDYTILQPTYFMEIWLSPPLGFDYINATATIYGDGKNKLPWISLKDVASFAVAALDNPAAKKAILELGGPDHLSPLEIVEIFEHHGGKPFTIQHVPEDTLHTQKEAAGDSMSKSFAYLMLGYAHGCDIDMKKILEYFPVRLTSVQEYAKRVLPQEAEIM